MHNYSTISKIQLQALTNGSQQLTKYFEQKTNDLFQGVEFIRAYISRGKTLTYFK